jgi:Protein of unknown function (DUF3592)
MQIAFLYVGLFFVAVGVAIVVAETRARIGATRVPARVVGFSTGREKSSSFYAVAAYEAPDGVRRYVEGTVGSSSPIGGVGDSVTVLVRPADPEHAVVESLLTYVVGAVLAAMGLASCVVFFVVFRADTLSLVAAAGVTACLAYKIRGAWRATPMPLDAWRQYKAAITGPRVFTDATKANIAWADPAVLRDAMAKQRQANRFAVPLFLLAGPGLLFLGYHLGRNTEAFLERALHTRGRVVQMVGSHSSNSTTYAPVVEFTASGREYTFKDSVSSNPPSHRVGDVVDVLYDPAHPADARIDRGIWNKGVPVLVGAFGALLLFAGAWLLKRRSAPLPSFEPQI